jgi:hypothetical protein
LYVSVSYSAQYAKCSGKRQHIFLRKGLAFRLKNCSFYEAILVKGYFVTVIASVSQRLPCRRPGKQSFENQEIASAKSASQ